MTDLVVEMEKTISAPMDAVFDAWLDPKQLARFILPAPDMRSPEVTNDPVQGGAFEIIMHVGDKDIPHHGTYLEISRPQKLVFSWNSPFSVEGSTVTLELSDAGSGQTKITLRHVKFPSEESRDSHNGGWTRILEHLSSEMSKRAA